MTEELPEIPAVPPPPPPLSVRVAEHLGRALTDGELEVIEAVRELLRPVVPPAHWAGAMPEIPSPPLPPPSAGSEPPEIPFPSELLPADHVPDEWSIEF